MIILRRMMEGSKPGEATDFAKSIIAPVFRADLLVERERERARERESERAREREREQSR